MKIITWNCNMAFRKKAPIILIQQPDILIVPECEHPDKLQLNPAMPAPNDMLWFGSNINKGLGIFSYNGYRLKLIRNHNPALKMIVPVAVTGNDTKLTLYAIWANNPHDPDGQYVEQVWKALHHYDKKLTNKQTILIGDFNSNTIWDRKYRAGNHSNVVKRLEEKGIFSCYHLHHKQTQGKEEHATWFMYRHRDKPYHLDYCFASADIADKVTDVHVGTHESWSSLSDHSPLIVTVDL